MDFYVIVMISQYILAIRSFRVITTVPRSAGMITFPWTQDTIHLLFLAGVQRIPQRTLLKCTLMFFLSENFLMRDHRYYTLTHMATLPAWVPHGTNGRVCQKSPASNTMTPSNSHIIPLMWGLCSVPQNIPCASWCSHSRQWAYSPTVFGPCCFVLRCCTEIFLYSWVWKAAWVILPLSSRVAGMPEDAKVKAMPQSFLIFIRRKLMRKVFPVPPGAPRKKNCTAPDSMLVRTWWYEWLIH